MKHQPIILDGAMGTMLQAKGLKLGDRPDIFGMEHPDILLSIHEEYINAGSDCIYANTFGANAHKLAGTGHTVSEVISANIATAKKAAASAGRVVKVALDIGPIGELMEPLGTMSFDEAYQIYAEMIIEGEKAGADLVVLETMTDLREVRVAVLAAHENSTLPVWVTMSFEGNGRTFTGTLVSSMASTLEGLGVDAMGINCSLGPDEILPLIREMRQWTELPLIVKPNAGLPDPATGKYDMTAFDFGRQMMQYDGLNVYAMGGCCGTSPEYIRELSQNLSEGVQPENCLEQKSVDQAAAGAAGLKRRGVCTPSHMTEFGGVRVIGERINPTGKKRFQQALREHDLNYIMQCAIEQQDAGADILDINVGLPGIDEAVMMTEVINAVQSVCDLPLQIDSSDPAAIEAGLRTCCGRAIVNSVNGDEEKLEAILPIVKKYGAAVIGLTMDHTGIPTTTEQRFEIAQRILKYTDKYEIPREDVLIDCLTLTISAQQEQAKETLDAVKMVSEQLGCHCTLGVSNISFGLPMRNHVTESFLTQAMQNGLDFPIINPNVKSIMDTVFSFRALSGEDEGCNAYIERFAQEAEASKAAAATAGGSQGTAVGAGASKPAQSAASGTKSVMTIQDAVLKGLKQETADLTRDLLQKMSEMSVINDELIPALDVVGEKYESQKIFLPQLINAASAACAGFDIIKERIAQRGGESISKGKIVLATVEGDIHDIGKNIVKVVLENYGYTVIDLGRDVPVNTVVEAVIAEDVKLVGLSALMTTTVESMKRTIEAIRESGHECKIFVGGAVLTEEYAMEIGADYYTKDAKASADVAKLILG